MKYFLFTILCFLKLFEALALENTLVASGSAPILRDDHAKAKQQAIANAKRTLLLQLLKNFLPPDIMLPFKNKNFTPNPSNQKDAYKIQTHILKKADQFIGELSVIKERFSKDYKSFHIDLEATVFQGHLISVLENLDLPVQFVGGLTPVIVSVRGISLGEQHQQFINEVFARDFRWRDWGIYILTSSTIVYRGEYAGNFSKWLQKIQKQQFQSSLRIAQLQYQPPYLHLQLDVMNTIQQLQPAQISKRLEQTLNDRGLPQPRLQVETRTDVLSSLPAATLVYGKITRRGGSASFQLEGTNLQRLKFQWFPIGKTRLAPKIWIYDKNWNLLVEKVLKKNLSETLPQIIEWSHKNSDDKLPKYIRIVDETGYIENDAGSLLSLDYLLRWTAQ